MEWRKVICSLILIFACFACRAQFYMYGDDPGLTRWNSIQTQNYRIVYPRTLDSLSRVYANVLEQYSIASGKSTGFLTNQSYHRRMPVILHPFSVTSNGVVVWTPRRMEFHTMQNPYNTESLPWVKELAIHESRHSAQMQFTNSGSYKLFNIVIGQMWPAAASALYGNKAFTEGDAVVAETALTDAGRGRTSDFLEYYRMAFDREDFRDFYKWMYGSIKHYSPSYYSLGYITVAGIRTQYDDPMYMERFFDNVFRHKLWPFPMFNIQHTVKEASGKNFRKTFREIEDSLSVEWKEEASLRGPAMVSEQFSSTPRRYRTYSGSVLAGDRILSVRRGMDTAAQIVDVSAGERVISSFSASASALQWSSTLGKVFWSEKIPDPRWSLAGSSVIRYLIPGNETIGRLTPNGKRYFNPAPSPVDGRIAVTSYPYEGGSEVVVLNGWSGEDLSTYHAPDHIQIVESAWNGEDIIVSGVSDAGFGLYLANGGFSTILEPKHVKIKQLRSNGNGELLFVCDRDGTDELYSFDLNKAELTKMSSVRYAASDFVFKGDSLYYSMLENESRIIWRTAIKDLPRQKADWNKTFSYKVADKLSAQEKELGSFDVMPEAQISAPKKYSKPLNLIRIHSWAPFYFNYDTIKSLSTDISSYGITPGAIVFFQNDLGTSSGQIGYSVNWRKGEKAKQSAHLQYTYSGLYPVFEASFDYYNYGRVYYNLGQRINGKKVATFISTASYGEEDYLAGNISAYVPLDFSRGGWSNGIIPQIKYSISNNLFNTGMMHYDVPPHIHSYYSRLVGVDNAPSYFMQRLSANLRLYSIRNGYSNGVYPKFGFGIEFGASKRVGLQDIYSPNLYIYSYGYLPGIVPEHGIRLTAIMQSHLGKSIFSENVVNCLPRGFVSTPVQSSAFVGAGSQYRLSIDYGMNVLPVDWSFLCPAAYIRNFILKPHFDISFFNSKDRKDSLFSVGAEFSAALGNFLWLPFESEIGVTYSYNSGKSFEYFNNMTIADRHYVGMVFNIDFE